MLARWNDRAKCSKSIFAKECKDWATSGIHNAQFSGRLLRYLLMHEAHSLSNVHLFYPFPDAWKHLCALQYVSMSMPHHPCVDELRLEEPSWKMAIRRVRVASQQAWPCNSWQVFGHARSLKMVETACKSQDLGRGPYVDRWMLLDQSLTQDSSWVIKINKMFNPAFSFDFDGIFIDLFFFVYSLLMPKFQSEAKLVLPGD